MFKVKLIRWQNVISIFFLRQITYYVYVRTAVWPNIVFFIEEVIIEVIVIIETVDWTAGCGDHEEEKNTQGEHTFHISLSFFPTVFPLKYYLVLYPNNNR